jgi:hypothetical protein
MVKTWQPSSVGGHGKLKNTSQKIIDPKTQEEKKARRKAQGRLSYQNHREDRLAKRAVYRATHREEIRQKKYEAYHRDIEATHAKTAAYRAPRRERYQQTLKAWRQANPDKAHAIHTRYYAAHLDAIRLRTKRYRLTHTEELAKRNADYRKAHQAERALARALRHEKRQADKNAHAHEKRQRYLTYHAVYRATHRAQLDASIAAWRLAHPEKRKEFHAKRRARKYHAPINDFTAAQWREMQEAYDHRCVYCGRRAKGRLTQDHLTPLSKGGAHTASNILPACNRCNSKKMAGGVLKPVQPLLLTIAPQKPRRSRGDSKHI